VDRSLRPEVVVPIAKLEIVNLLKRELAFLERGGYGGTMPWRPVSMFLDSPSCPNRLDVERTTPCSQCWLFQFVPERFRQEMDACHFIPLNRDGESVHSMSRQYTAAEVEGALKIWLEAEIRHLEALETRPASDRVH
jgi:hypothetical protein